jgi:hypothetical protein
MNNASNDQFGGRDTPAARGDKASPTGKQTPNTDMQPEDTGSVESGTAGAMKQTSKTPAESGDKQ